MTAPARVWNGKVRGLPMALCLGLGVALGRVQDALLTVLWRGNLASLGRGSRILRGATIRYPGSVRIGSAVSIGRNSEISSEHPDGFCTIGDGVVIGVGCRLDSSGGLTIADGVVISERAMLLTHAHGHDPKSYPAKAFLEVGEKAWIGAGAIVVEGVGRIGSHAIVAAGSIVTKPVPNGAIVAGVPARVIGTCYR